MTDFRSLLNFSLRLPICNGEENDFIVFCISHYPALILRLRHFLSSYAISHYSMICTNCLHHIIRFYVTYVLSLRYYRHKHVMLYSPQMTIQDRICRNTGARLAEQEVKTSNYSCSICQMSLNSILQIY